MSFLKKLLPIAGAAAGFYLGPAGSAAVSSALGSGIGTLLAGGDLKDAIKNSAIAGIAGGGLQSAQAASATQVAGQTAAATQAAQAEKALAALEGSKAAAAAAPIAKSQAAASGIAKLLSPGGLALTSLGLGLLGPMIEGDNEVELTELQKEQLRTGERVPGYKGRDVVPRYQYAQGGFIQGPGTGTSDDIPARIYQNGTPVQEARLSDGEFVMTKRAVDGAGGASRMYEMMKQYERMA